MKEKQFQIEGPCLGKLRACEFSCPCQEEFSELDVRNKQTKEGEMPREECFNCLKPALRLKGEAAQ